MRAGLSCWRAPNAALRRRNIRRHRSSQSVVGYGRAEKRQVMEMTKTMLHLQRMPRPDDAADALALAICHAHTEGSQLVRQRLQKFEVDAGQGGTRKR